MRKPDDACGAARLRRAPLRRSGTTHAAEGECDDRRSEDLEVALYWARQSGRLWVKVTNRQSGHTARIDATAANALDVFRHPYAYAA
jgi:hypothetical protein